ncbi:DUF3142 domain-containing protein [Achromobacter xylosoxidans]|nr:DUF3142 domain-containing protein [Achromobacter xylosoxidans]
MNALAKRCSAAIFSVLLLLLAACGKQADLPGDAYVWQRVWTPPVSQALADSADIVRAWRVLMGEMNPDGRWFTAAPDLAALAAAKRPVIMVLRLDGRADALPSAEVLARIAAARSAWRDAGVALAGIEIDYDCPTSKLPAYAAFLAALKPGLGPDLPLSITALPTWLNGSGLDELLRIPDEAVLQVHAVLSPEQGLFNAKRASAWLTAFADRTQRPWRVALATYGSRVSWNDDGSIAAVESERSALLPGGRASELVATPASMAAFVDEIHRSRPPGLAGIVWFRLPTARDERAWSPTTWRAVLTRQPLLPTLSVTARATGGNGAQDLILSNGGNADAALPFAIRWDGACRAADGINGYTLEHDSGGAFLRRSQDGLLHAGGQRNIGWIRCENGPSSFHVQP